jgi:assimilatory nitrate reductase catalytic subunit
MNPQETRSTCPYCGVGCGVIIASEGAQITGVRGDPDHPANFAKLCSKGATLHLTASAAVTRQTRLLQPMRRLHRREAPRPVAWDDAMDFAAETFAQIVQESGPDAVGFYISGQLLTEDYYVFNKLAKGLLGTNNIDTNSRLCMSSAVAGYKLTLGADAPPACYDDLNHADCVFIAGSNTAWAHPVLFRRLEEARAARPQMKLIVADPRRTDTAESADLFLPLQPGTDVMLFHGLLHIMLWEGWTDGAYIHAHTTGFDALKALVRDCTPDHVASVCGLRKEDLFTAARWFAGAQSHQTAGRGATLSLYCQGLNQSSSGTAKNAALINLHLATGQIGRPGAGPFSLTGQPNAMGGREVGGLANLLSAHRDMANPQHRAEVAALWGVPSVPHQPGKAAMEMFQAAADGEIKALWIACTNPAQSLPDQAMVRRALERAELVVVQEAFSTTATCEFADLLLPATTWGEKMGTVTNSERRISRVRPAVSAPGQARHDWAIAADLGRRLQARLHPDWPALFPAADQPAEAAVETIWNEHRESTRGRDLDITGLSYARLEQHGPTQWPCPEGATSGQQRLYADGHFPTPDGRARFASVEYRPVAEPRTARHPFSLNTGRLRDQWHGMSRTGTLGRLFGHVPEPGMQMHPQDMARRLLAPGDLVHLTSARGSLVLPVQPSDSVGLSQVFVPMHWGSEFVGGRSNAGSTMAGINALTSPAVCPQSRQPELKHAAVKVLKAELPWSLLGMAWLPGDQALAVRESLKPWMARFDFASCVPFARQGAMAEAGAGDQVGVLFRAAADTAAAPEELAALEGLLGLHGADTLRYADARRGQHRSMRLVRSGDTTQLQAFLLAGDTRAESWVRALLQDELPAQAYGRLLLLPGAKAPVAVPAQGAVVCTCMGVTDPAIRTHLSACSGTSGERLASLQGALGCGTQCGSCLPELRRRVQQTAPATAAA